MELDFRKKSRRGRMMRSRSCKTQEVREIGRKEAGESTGLPILFIHSRVRAQARFAGLSSDWATTTGRLLGPTICLPHKDGGIPLSALPKDTTAKLASLFSTLSFMC